MQGTLQGVLQSTQCHSDHHYLTFNLSHFQQVKIETADTKMFTASLDPSVIRHTKKNPTVSDERDCLLSDLSSAAVS